MMIVARLSMCLSLGACASTPPDTGLSDSTEIASMPDPKPAIRDHIVPGTTMANVPLQQQTLDQLKSSVITYSSKHDCDPSKLTVVDTDSFGQPSKSKYSVMFKEWKELWTLDVCGDRLQIEIAYMQHVSGIISLSAKQSSWSAL